MAAQLVRKDETVPDPIEGEDKYDQYMLNRMMVIAGNTQKAILLHSWSNTWLAERNYRTCSRLNFLMMVWLHYQREGWLVDYHRPGFQYVMPSQTWRKNWSESLMNMASNLSLYAHTPLPDALAMPVSVAKKFFDGKPFDDWQKGREAEQKIQIAIVNRLDNLTRASETLPNQSPD